MVSNCAYVNTYIVQLHVMYCCQNYLIVVYIRFLLALWMDVHSQWVCGTLPLFVCGVECPKTVIILCHKAN